MAEPIQLDSLGLSVVAQPLTPDAFAPFGDVVANPHPHLHPSSTRLPPNAHKANQGTALQYRDVSRLQNLYDQAPSRTSRPAMSIFAVAETPTANPIAVRVLERHPFTTQTFTPLASSHTSSYLVVVAPSLPPSPLDDGLPVPHGAGLPGGGLPDLHRLRAFVAESDQAVTYGAGTWHSPMVALGTPGRIQSFQVVQFVSGEPEEDCQLVGLGTHCRGEGGACRSSSPGEGGVRVLVKPVGRRLDGKTTLFMAASLPLLIFFLVFTRYSSPS